ncbi:MAG: hypothetical protein Q7J15_00025 [Candidatus Desulfaltia sp.]|nr:hypothetical protein [Candidatus Desulfaltia sp.]
MNKNLNFDYVDFDTVGEPWNLYKLEDGSLIKFKLVLVKVMPNKNDPKNYSLNTANVVGVQSPRELRGAPTSPPTKGPYNDFEKKDLTPEIIKESWNEYRLKDGTVLKIKPAITAINKTKSFDSHGEPIYVVHSQVLVKPIK